jgi:hypothetical protein
MEPTHYPSSENLQLGRLVSLAPFFVTLRRTCAYANPEPSSANQTEDIMLSPTNAHALPIINLGHFTAHIHCLHIKAEMCCSTFQLECL